MTLKINKQDIDQLCQNIQSRQLDRIEKVVMFLGHAHSGHSIIGALMDAHKDIAIANEINIPKILLDHKLDKTQLLKLILASSLKKPEWINTGYKYNVTNGYQGKTHSPIIIGDKKGGGSIRILRKNPEVIDLLFEMFGNRLKYINVLRNPMDNIAALSHYWNEPVSMKHVDRYYENLETTLFIEKKFPGNFHKIRHTEFINKPEQELMRLFDFLKIKAENSIVKNWVNIVRSKENNRAQKLKWPKNILNEIKIKNIKYNLTD